MESLLTELLRLWGDCRKGAPILRDILYDLTEGEGCAGSRRTVTRWAVFLNAPTRFTSILSYLRIMQLLGCRVVQTHVASRGNVITLRIVILVYIEATGLPE
jgi:hypothetical protein